MPGEVAPAAGGAGAGGDQQQRGGLSGIVQTVLRMAMMWYFMNLMKSKTNPATSPGTGGVATMTYPAMQKGDLLDLYCFISERPSYDGNDYDMADLVWSETAVKLATHDPRNSTFIYEPSEAVQNNGTVYLHVVLARAGHPISPFDDLYEHDKVFSSVTPLNVYMPKPKNSTGVNLLTDTPLEPQHKEKNATREMVSFMRPNITIQLVDHFQPYKRNAIPPQIGNALRYDSDGNYYPIVFFNDFWLLRDKFIPLNSSVTNVTLHFDFGHASFYYWQILQQMEQSFSMQVNLGLSQEGESDEVKRVLIEGNPYFLALTMAVSLLHTVFDMLAFKNDIGFWKNNKSMEGLSARSILINAFCQVVILLYLIDNDTSFVVLLSAFLGTGIEIWKVTKAFKVTINERFPYIKLEDRASYSGKHNTKKHDEDAVRYLSYVLFPLVIGYSIYTLMYKTHKSWYSWVLTTLVGAVYMFGFILMCPQLYLNYKLKSVAHLPWRQMTYKFLNTIIDDLFAFVIKMPLLHRLSVFRDDVIFLIYLYQRWIYRVDKTRTNEFGWSEEQAAGAEGAAAAAAPAGGERLLEDKVEGAGAAVQRKKKKGADKEREGTENGAAGTANGNGVAAAEGPAASGSKKDK